MKRTITGLCVALAIGLSTATINTCALHASPQDTKTKAKTSADDKRKSATLKPATIKNGVAKLSPENTRIEFVGTHVGEDPKPRLGGFGKFQGQIKIEDNKITSITVKIEIDSIWTEFANLTSHLKRSDFFDVEKFDKSTFESTKIIQNADGEITVIGDMTLLGNKKEISFSAKTKTDESGVVLSSRFKIDRTIFGMTKMTKGVEKVVSVSVTVGQATEKLKSKPGNGSENKKKRLNLDQLKLVSLHLPNML